MALEVQVRGGKALMLLTLLTTETKQAQRPVRRLNVLEPLGWI